MIYANLINVCRFDYNLLIMTPNKPTPKFPSKNQLYFGDNLDILKQLYREHPQGFIDLIYIDPPFNSKRNYNVLFESVDLTDSTAQKEAFADTWSNVSYMDTLNELSDLDISLYNFLKNLDNTNISKGAISYLVTMAIRLWYMHRLLKNTGSFYLHCDPTMSHYLKILCDLIFGEKNFRNEIIWKRTSAHSDAKGFGNAHDVILYYTATDKNKWVQTYQPYTKDYTDTYYRYKDSDGRRWMSDNLSAKGLSGGGYNYKWKGINGLWRCPETTMIELDNQGKIYYTKNNIPRRKRYLDESKGLPTQDIWDNIEPLRSWHNEKMGYPTQKPEALLEQILTASSNESDVIADFFCGCGTAVTVAEKLKRKWIGVDISHLAVKLISDWLIAMAMK